MSVKFIPSLSIPKNPNALEIGRGTEYPFKLVVRPRYRKRVKGSDSEELLQALAGWIPEPMHPYQPLFR